MLGSPPPLRNPSPHTIVYPVGATAFLLLFPLFVLHGPQQADGKHYSIGAHWLLPDRSHEDLLWHAKLIACSVIAMESTATVMFSVPWR